MYFAELSWQCATNIANSKPQAVHTIPMLTSTSQKFLCYWSIVIFVVVCSALAFFGRGILLDRAIRVHLATVEYNGIIFFCAFQPLRESLVLQTGGQNARNPLTNMSAPKKSYVRRSERLQILRRKMRTARRSRGRSQNSSCLPSSKGRRRRRTAKKDVGVGVSPIRPPRGLKKAIGN